MRRAWFLTMPFHCLCGIVVGDRAMVLPASIHFGGRDILSCADHPATMKLKKYKFVSRKLVYKIWRA